jgi:POLO box duplicated region
MFFNDQTSILLSSDGTKFDYLPSTGQATSGLIESHPRELEKKVKLAVRYKGYMTDNLHGTEPVQSGSDTKIFLADFRRAKSAVLFRMSDNAIQVPPPKGEAS